MFNYEKYLFLFLSLIELSNAYLVFPFKLTNLKLNIAYDNSSDFVNKFMKEMSKNKLYTTITIGEPQKEVIMYLSLLDSYFGIMKDYCTKDVISTYDPYVSNSFTFGEEKTITISDLLYARKANDTFYFYTNKNLEEKKNITFEFLTVNKTMNTIDDYIPDAFCGKIGFLKRYYYPYSNTFINFIDYTKKNKIIDSYQYGIFFFDKEESYKIDKEIQNKYDGLIFLGLTDKDYPNIFKKYGDIDGSYLLMGKSKNIGGIFNYIYFQHLDRKIYCEKELSFEMDLEHNYVICPKDYYENIKKYYFDEYINKTICEERSSLKDGDKYSMIVCNLEIKKDLSKFPSLELFYMDLNYQFQLDYKDLFFEIDNKIYFLVIYQQMMSDSSSLWNFGKLLIQKYPFMFNEDRKTLYFVHLDKYQDHSKEPDPKQNTDDADENSDINISDNPEISDDNSNDKKNSKKKDENNFWSKYKIYIIVGIVIIVLIIGIILGYIFGRKVWEKHRKTRANELIDDNYEYKENEGDKIIN